MYKRLDNGAFDWPRSANEALEISADQYRMLMQGLDIIARRPIKELEDPPKAM
jgi:transposase